MMAWVSLTNSSLTNSPGGIITVAPGYPPPRSQYPGDAISLGVVQGHTFDVSYQRDTFSDTTVFFARCLSCGYVHQGRLTMTAFASSVNQHALVKDFVEGLVSQGNRMPCSHVVGPLPPRAMRPSDDAIYEAFLDDIEERKNGPKVPALSEWLTELLAERGPLIESEVFDLASTDDWKGLRALATDLGFYGNGLYALPPDHPMHKEAA